MLTQMFKSLLCDACQELDIPITPAEEGLVYKPIEAGVGEMRDVEKAFARLFASDDGQKVLAHLQVITFQRALSATSPDQQLRYMEGQRSLLATILRLIDRGRKPTKRTLTSHTS